jgi:hypothetical protein
MTLKKITKILTSKSVGTGFLSYEKRTYRTAVSQRLRNTFIEDVEATVSGKYSGITQESPRNPEHRA